MLATLSLAESLSPAEFAAWVDGGFFDLRGGPELMMFTKILMNRWAAEDPEGLLTWAMRNKNGAGAGVMREWAGKDPQRLLAWFRENRNDEVEASMLGKIAFKSPDLAIQRLREMAESGMSDNAMRSTHELMDLLADKSPHLLEELAATLPADLRLKADVVLSRKRMEESFSSELGNLWDRPDGWKIFNNLITDDIRKKFMGELGNMPDEWRRLLASNPYNFIQSENAREWMTADLEGAGFNPSEIKEIRGNVLQHLSWRDPMAAVEDFGSVELSDYLRKNVIEQICRNNTEAGRKLVELLTEEEKGMANAILDGKGESQTVSVDAKTTPDELIRKILEVDTGNAGKSPSFPELIGWDGDKIHALADGMSKLPDDQRLRVANAIMANSNYNRAPQELQGAALRYLVENPEGAISGDEKIHDGLIAKVCIHASTLVVQDPASAVSWVGSLPAGEAKSWAQKNLMKFWKHHDPEAASAWEKSLPAADREAIGKINP